MIWQRKQLMRAAAVAALAISTTASGVVLMAQDNPDTQVETQSAHPYLGVRLTDGDNGVEVVAVAEGSPAEAAGIEAGDILVRIGDSDVATVVEAAEAVATLAVGDAVSVTIERDGEAQTLDATLAEAPAQDHAGNRPGWGSRGDRLEEMFAHLGGLNFAYDSDTSQWIVNDIAEDSPLYEAGLRAGDVLTAVNGESLEGPDLLNLFATLSQSDTITLAVERDGEAYEFEVATADLLSLDGMPQVFEFSQGMGGDFGQLFNRAGSLPFSYDEETGALTVNEIAEDSPLYEAGLRTGDVVTAVNGEAFDASNLREVLRSVLNSDTMTLTVERDGESQDIEVAVVDLFALSGLPQMFQFGGRDGRENFSQMAPFATQGGRLGLSFLPLDEETAAENDVTATEGALVMEVVEGSAAADAGLQAGDIVTAVNSEAVNEEWTLRDRIAAYEPGDVVTLEVTRGDESLQIEVTLGEPEATMSQGMMMPFGNFNFGGQGMPFGDLLGQGVMPFGFDMLIPSPDGSLEGGAQAVPASPNL